MNYPLWRELALIVQRPGGWVLLLLAVLAIVMAFVWVLSVGWPFRFTVRQLPIRMDDELAQQDREASTCGAIQAARSFHTAAAKGFANRPRPINPNHSRKDCA